MPMAAGGEAIDPITVLDLFAGCGGLTEGFHQFRPFEAGRPAFRTVGAVEWDPAAAASYAMNFGAGAMRHRHYDPPEVICGDIAEWTPVWGSGEVDVVAGGPPCQGFSGLNRDGVRAERNQLWQEFIRVVVALQPKVFVIENVDRFVRSAEFRDLKERIGNRDLTNYRLVDAPGVKQGDSEWGHDKRYLLNSADYGALQARRRAIVIGVRTDVHLPVDRMQYPEATHSQDVLAHQDEIEGLDVPSGQLPWRTVDELFLETATWSLSATELPAGRSVVVDGISDAVPVPSPPLNCTSPGTRNPSHSHVSARYQSGGTAKHCEADSCVASMTVRSRSLRRSVSGTTELANPDYSVRIELLFAAFRLRGGWWFAR